jgi:hypothetical protein
LDLTLPEVRLLNQYFEQDWLDFELSMPLEWKRDNFFQSRCPISITSRYGQNQPICTPNGDHQQAADLWDQRRSYDNIDFVTFALATDIS